MKTIRRRLGCLLLAAVMLLSMIPAAFAAPTPGMDNFKRTKTYTAGTFSDVSEGAWYTGSIKSAYELGLAEGSAGKFDRKSNMTVQEAATLAARLHAIYHTGSTSCLKPSTPWYKVYLDYALENGIITQEQITNRKNNATRAECAAMLSKAIPASELAAINTVDDGAIPDVPANSPYYNDIYTLYRAGILTGNDAKGTFTPNAPIDRVSMITIATRMVDKTLRQKVTLTVALTGIQTKNSMWLYPGDTYQLTATPVPSNAKLSAVTWTSADPKVATVSATGLVTMVAPGKTTVTAKTASGLTAVCTVNVMKRAVEGVTLDQTNVNTYLGQSVQLKATINPANATDQTLTWTSSNPAVATVSATGLVTPLAIGNTTITVKTGNDKTATCTVNVTQIGTIANPMPADGTMTISLQKWSSDPIKDIRITCTNVISGSAANSLAKSENKYNKTPNSNQEWRFYEFSVNYVSCQGGNEVLEATDLIYDDTFFTTSGAKVNVADKATLSNLYDGYGVFDVELYPGSTGKIVIGLLINKGAGDLLLRVPNKSANDNTWVLCTVHEVPSAPSTPSDPSAPVGEVGSLSNPAPADGTMTISLQKWSSDPIKDIRITCTNVVSGTAANSLAKSENRYNKTPNSSQEWRFYEFSVNYVSCQGGNEVLEATDLIYDDTFFTTSGAKVNVADKATLSNKYDGYGVFDVELYPGATGKIVIGLLINKDAGDLLLRVPNKSANDNTWVLCTADGSAPSTPSTPSTPSSGSGENYFYSGFSGVPSFGNCFGIRPTYSTGSGGYFYSSTSIDSSGFSDQFAAMYSARLEANGFHYAGSTQSSSGSTLLIFRNSSIGRTVTFGVAVVGSTVGILISVT